MSEHRESYTSPDLSVTITEDEANHAWAEFASIDWAAVEADLPTGSADSTGRPLNRHNINLQRAFMSASLVCLRVGHENAVDESFKLMDNPHFRIMVDTALRTYKDVVGPVR